MAHPHPTSSPVAAPEVTAAKRAVAFVFAGAGFAFASWASRIPQVRSELGLDPGELGLLLLALALGSLTSLPLAGAAVGRFGDRRVITVMSVVSAAGLATIAVGQTQGIAPVAFGLYLSGFGFGLWDVAMNVHGTVVERHLGRTVLPRFHAGFSIGTVTGAGVGAGVVALEVAVLPHLLLTAVVTALAMPTAVRWFLDEDGRTERPAGAGGDDVTATRVDGLADAQSTHAPTPQGPSTDRQRSPALAAWTDPRTLLIGLFVLCMGFSEGTGNDWLSVAVIDGYDTSDALGTVTFTVFLVAMTVGRWFGPPVIDRHGRTIVARASSAVAAAGLLLVVFGSAFPLAVLGAALWGVGTAVGFPIGISAAADDPEHAAARVGVASSIGYVAFLAGPPLIGLLGDEVGTLRSLTVAAALLAGSVLLASVLRGRGAAARPATAG